MDAPVLKLACRDEGEEGECEFTVNDSGGDGLCCKVGEGNCKVTTSNRALIAEGGEFGYRETTKFAIPFVNRHCPHHQA